MMVEKEKDFPAVVGAEEAQSHILFLKKAVQGRDPVCQETVGDTALVSEEGAAAVVAGYGIAALFR